MNLLTAVLHMMVAAACAEASSAVCLSQVTCPCGKTGRNFTYCSSNLSQTGDICEQWAHCKQCDQEVGHCTECPPGHIGPTCSQEPGSELLVRPKRQYGYPHDSPQRAQRAPFAGGSDSCPDLKNTELVALRCFATGTTRTCRGWCLTGYVFKGREGEKEIEMTCEEGRWSPTQSFPDCVPSGQCQLETSKVGGGSYNCTSEMDGTRCDVVCDGRRQGWFFCYPGREWDPKLPYCVRAKGDVNVISADLKECDCRNGGTCDQSGRCICPPGRTGPRCEEEGSNIIGAYPRRCDCQNGATCDPYGRCVCPLGRTGPRCEESFTSCPNLTNTKLVAIDCIDARNVRTCRGRCLTGHVFKGREEEDEITLTCQGGAWTPTQTFPDCVPNGDCELVLTGQGGGSYNCSMEMEGTRCNVICDGRSQGVYFCYPGREWVPDLPRCVKAKDGSTIISEDTEQCECQNGGTCDPYGRCTCPFGRTGIHCEKGAPTIIGSQSGRCECINGGTCDPYGRCVCPAGRTGTRCEEVACTNPSPLDNAIILNVNRYTSFRETYRPGETVWFYCIRGFIMQGSDSITCQTSGRWTKKPTCVPQTVAAENTTPAPVYCTHPGSITNGYSLNMLGAPTLSTAKYKPGETVWFYCNDGFTMQGSDSITCQISGTWTKKPTCIRQTVTAAPTTEITQATVICPDPGDVQNADRDVNGPTGSNPVYYPGYIVIYTCRPGYVRKGPVYVTCLSTGSWSRQKPFCTLITPEPNSPTEPPVLDSLFCHDPGEVINGDRTSNPPLSAIHQQGFRQGSRIMYFCKNGYQLQGDQSIFCLVTGEWSSTKPTCEPASRLEDPPVPDSLYCLDPGEVANGNRVSNPPLSAIREQGFRQGSRVMYSCNEDYQLQGDYSLFCLFNGEWSSNKPRCEPISRSAEDNRVFCRDPGPIKNGKAMVYPPGGSARRFVVEHNFEYLQGTVLEYECDDGYTPIGALSITCGSNGFWSAVIPSCIEKSSDYESYCDNPGRLANGQVEIHPMQGQWRQPTLDDEGFREETRLQFACDQGFELVGASSATCGSDGSWSNALPYCKKGNPIPDELMYCDNPGKISNGKVREFMAIDQRRQPSESNSPKKYPQYTRLHFSCDRGYKLKGTPNITCGTNGQWSAKPPSCEGACGKSQGTTQRITFGAVTRAGQWPWTVAVAVVYDGVSVVECGGVLIDRRSVLTAAHCFDTSGSFELYFGKHRRRNEDDDNKVEKRTNLTVTVHPSYNSSTFDSDIALVRFWPEIRYTSRIQPICLPTPESTANNIRRGKDGIVTGWGLNEKDMPSESLFMAYLPVLPGDYCMKAYRSQGKNFPITSNMYCAGREEGGTSACSGDSGSPMVFYDDVMEHYTLEGIVSFGVNGQCSMPKSYTVMTKILPYLPWVIRSNYIS